MPLEARSLAPVVILAVAIGAWVWMFVSLLRPWRRRAAIRSYTERLRPELLRSSGKKPAYTPAEIQNAARNAGVNTDYLCYAYAGFLTREDFEFLHEQRGEICSYTEMRAEVIAVVGECWSEAYDQYVDTGHQAELSHSGGHHDHAFGSFDAHHHSHHDHTDHVSMPDLDGGGEAHAGHHEGVDGAGGMDFGGGGHSDGGDFGGGGDQGGGGDFGGGSSSGDD